MVMGPTIIGTAVCLPRAAWPRLTSATTFEQSSLGAVAAEISGTYRVRCTLVVLLGLRQSADAGRRLAEWGRRHASAWEGARELATEVTEGQEWWHGGGEAREGEVGRRRGCGSWCLLARCC